MQSESGQKGSLKLKTLTSLSLFLWPSAEAPYYLQLTKSQIQDVFVSNDVMVEHHSLQQLGVRALHLPWANSRTGPGGVRANESNLKT